MKLARIHLSRNLRRGLFVLVLLGVIIAVLQLSTNGYSGNELAVAMLIYFVVGTAVLVGVDAVIRDLKSAGWKK